MNGDGTVAVSTLVNNSVKVVEVRRSGAQTGKIVNGTFIRRTPDIQEGSKATSGLEFFFSVKDEGTSVVSALEKSGSSITSDNGAIFIDFLVGDINTSEGKWREAKKADE